jgi:hypothetical protein
MGPVPSDVADSPLNKKYRLILDKGLYDSYTSTTKSTVYTKTKLEQFRETYLKNTRELLQPGGTLLVATCCHTEAYMKQTIGQKGTSG